MANRIKRLIALIICVLTLGTSMLCACGEVPLAPNNPEGAYEVINGTNGVDFIINFPAEKDIKVLQITDTQMQDYYHPMRSETRQRQIRNAFFDRQNLSGAERAENLSISHQIRTWQYVDEAVTSVAPDLIVATGDNIYGECDDNGTLWMEFCTKMDSYKIPWLVVFGNHDNESDQGVRWQIQQLKNCEYCIFKQGNVTGNCNYNVLIQSGGVSKYLFYMLDSNGCKDKSGDEGIKSTNIDLSIIHQDIEVCLDQINWVYDSYQTASEKYGEVPVHTFMHVAPSEATYALTNKYPSTYNVLPFYANATGDLGVAKEVASGFSSSLFWLTMKDVNCEGIYVGHQHKIATSINYDGIRITFGLKTGTYDYHADDMLGATEITLKPDTQSFKVAYVHSRIPYSTNYSSDRTKN